MYTNENGTAALKMPSNYTLLDAEEMEYVDGGIDIRIKKNTCSTIATYVYGAGWGITAAVAISAISQKLTAVGTRIVKLAGIIGSTFGIVGTVIASIVAGLTVTNMVSFLTGVVTADRKNTGVTMTWYGGFFSNKRYC